ncbi:hypothetical protein BC936DRAFT_147504 [Jimgerdemannia flammicorona]|uniref:Uncharacterized protein n=1 Tax=Jimgerdemannia flammicorona TaxID=994334 RepID=A0A433D553_9FUNG|nr:hypothetical protein BC936DRAFT_147504 [Jimgerdemannia flammicorona]
MLAIKSEEGEAVKRTNVAGVKCAKKKKKKHALLLFSLPFNAIDIYFQKPPSEWSYLGFLHALKPSIAETQGSLQSLKSTWRKNYVKYLKNVLIKESQDENSIERVRVAHTLLQQGGICATSAGSAPRGGMEFRPPAQNFTVMQPWLVPSLAVVWGAVPRINIRKLMRRISKTSVVISVGLVPSLVRVYGNRGLIG